MNIFITGTDTGVGKTFVSAWLCHHWQAAYWKPVQCGLDDESDREFVSRTTEVTTYPETFRLRTPASPHYAAAQENLKLAVADFVIPTTLADAPKTLLIEGAGGVEVPLNSRERMGDLIAALHAPALIVARGGLGTINHTLLSLFALQRRHIPILGIVFTGDVRPENATAIYEHSGVPVVARLPQLPSAELPAFGTYCPPDLNHLTAKLRLT